jgi:hypothetical protein
VAVREGCLTPVWIRITVLSRWGNTTRFTLSVEAGEPVPFRE